MNVVSSRKYYVYLFFLGLAPLYINGVDDEINFDDFIQQFNTSPTEMFEDTAAISGSARAIPTPPVAVNLLYQLGIISFLETEYFYLQTNSLNKRNVLDLPVFVEPCDQRPGTVGVHLFFNKTDRNYFTENSSSVSSYLALQKQSTLDKLDIINQNVRNILMVNDFTVNIAQMFSLFSNFTVEQREAGFMFNGGYNNNCWCLQAFLPLYYLERNYFVTEQEQQEIKRVLGDSNDMNFAREHLISDKFGFGDLRVDIGYDICDTCKIATQAGPFFDFPTNCAWKKGIIGSSFIKNCQRPELNVLLLLQQDEGTVQPEQQQAFQDFALGAIDQLSANLLEASLGNGRHMGIGGFVKTRTNLGPFINMAWADPITFNSHVFLEYFLPAKTKRCFISQKDVAGFAAFSFESPTTEEAAQAVVFLEQQFIDLFYPFVFYAKSWPGFVFKWTTEGAIKYKRWRIAAGSDMWMRSAEKLTGIQRDIFSTPLPLLVDKATAPFAYQSKVFGSVAYKVKRMSYDFSMGLLFDTTVNSIGIGRDYTVSLHFEANF